MKHDGLIKHWDLIQKWKDNPDLVFECKEFHSTEWTETAVPAWQVDREYRIQPKKYKPLPYRRYLCYLDDSGTMGVRLAYWPLANLAEDNSHFISWIDKDWIKEEIEV